MANDVGVIFHDPSKPPSGVQDFIVCRHSWTNVARLRRYQHLRITKIRVWYDSQDAERATDYGGDEEYSLTHLIRPGTGDREGIAVGRANSSPSTGMPKKQDTYHEALTPETEAILFSSADAPSGIPRAFMAGDVHLLFFDTSSDDWDGATGAKVEERTADVVWPSSAS